MELHFLGAKYESEPLTLEVTEGSTGGLYRGSPWKIHRFQQQYRRRRSPIKLTYRGATYQP